MPAGIELVLDCAEPDRLARFWTEALGYRVAGSSGPYVKLVPGRMRGPALILQKVPEAKTVKNRMHLDIKAADVELEVQRLIAIGAKRVSDVMTEGPDDRWIVMADPEGNEFCVCWTGLLASEVEGVTIEAAHGTPDELRTKGILERMLRTYDASRFVFTDRVVIDEEAETTHSHPVLTLRTKFSVRTPLGVLAAFVHEQLHWHIADRSEAVDAAIADLRALYPEIPEESGGAARDRHSTYLHLIVNWLEHEALRELVGDEEALATTRAHAIDRWVYEQVLANGDRIGGIVRAHGLRVP